MNLLFALLLAGTAAAMEPGQQVTITLQDGTVVSGVVTSSATTPQPQQPPPQALPPMGFAGAQPGQPAAGQYYPGYGATYVGVPVIPVQPLSPQEQTRFLKQQEAEREARKRQVTTPTSDWQFNLQQALDRQAHGLPFNGP